MAARGLDIPECDAVFHLELPTDAAHYAHRAGRTGRAGETGEAVTFVGEEHVADMRKMATALKLDSQFIAAAGEAPAPTHKQRQGGSGNRAKHPASPGRGGHGAGRARAGGQDQRSQGGAPAGGGRRRRSGGNSR